MRSRSLGRWGSALGGRTRWPRWRPTSRASLLPDALAAARAIADDESRAEALAALAPYLPDALLSEALAAAGRSGRFGRARALAPLIPSLAEPMEPARWRRRTGRRRHQKRSAAGSGARDADTCAS